MTFAQHPAAQALKSLDAIGPQRGKKVLDSCEEKTKEDKVMDAAGAAAEFALADIRAAVAATLQAWSVTPSDALDEGETLAARLDAMLIGIADANKDGEITEEESNLIDIAFNAAWDYLNSKGVPEEDISSLLNDGDEAAGLRVGELLANEAPEGADAELADIDSFAFDSESQESVFDSAVASLDAVYKKAWAVRAGKKVRINKRISGTVRLSAKQKVAIKKAQLKTHSATARVSRMKSLRVRAKMGLNAK
ncbi:MAG: hypothetical protein KKD97_16500 [Gammaproteobacteria bacterium]|nr:hypothetical protein [Gammaproteobacteria bacterium]